MYVESEVREDKNKKRTQKYLLRTTNKKIPLNNRELMRYFPEKSFGRWRVGKNKSKNDRDGKDEKEMEWETLLLRVCICITLLVSHSSFHLFFDGKQISILQLIIRKKREKEGSRENIPKTPNL